MNGRSTKPGFRPPQASLRTPDAADSPESPLLQIHTFWHDAVMSSRLRQALHRVCPHELDGPGPAAAGVTVLLTDAAGVPDCAAAIRTLHADAPTLPLLVVTLDVDSAGIAHLLQCGAFDFAALPCGDDELLLRVRRALAAARRPAKAAAGPAALPGELVGDSPAFLKAIARIPSLAASGANVLLLGETGTGKEICAQAIHYRSPRAAGPWVAANCAAIPPELVEDELFGHVRGAYTHAHSGRAGLVQEAEGGTLFLDEIDSLPLSAQAKLLRFLEDKQYRMVGSSRVHAADVRVVAASNCDLRAAAAQSRFRQDLFFRLNVLGLTLPPLRERREDVPVLARYFLAAAGRECGRRLAAIAPGAMQCLLDYAWPGNVRELKHTIQRAALLAAGPAIEAHDLELDGVTPASRLPQSFRDAKARAVAAFERRYLEQLLIESGGNISRAARAAHKNRRAFFELLRRHAIDAGGFRKPAI